MKKTYTKPVAEKIEFDYRNQIVASGNSCWSTVAFKQEGGICISEEKDKVYTWYDNQG